MKSPSAVKRPSATCHGVSPCTCAHHGRHLRRLARIGPAHELHARAERLAGPLGLVDALGPPADPQAVIPAGHQAGVARAESLPHDGMRHAELERRQPVAVGPLHVQPGLRRDAVVAQRARDPAEPRRAPHLAGDPHAEQLLIARADLLELLQHVVVAARAR